MRACSRAVGAVMLVLTMACAGDGDGGAAGQGAAGARPGVTSEGFVLSVQPFIEQQNACSCHQSDPLMANFSLKPDVAYENLVNMPALQLPSMMRVRPGSLNESYLWHKISGTHLEVGGSGEIMPSNIPLNEEERMIFARWIAAGAPP